VIATIFVFMPFTKLIKVAYLVIIPWLFNKAEQIDQDIAETKEIAIEARGKEEQAHAIAQQAQETAEKTKSAPWLRTKSML